MNSTPEFNSDSAYAFIETQIAFGPRIPNSIGHTSCGNLLVGKLSTYGFSIVEQIDSVNGHDNRLYKLRNIIASINTDNPNRIMICAHWDSRPYADQDGSDKLTPIVGANDNASGVAILLEMARIMSKQAPTIGVDFVFFDLEDQGRPATETDADPYDHGFCLGSQYWSKNLKGYTAKYGILLDMVGAAGAKFTLEGVSMKYAQTLVERVWDTGNQLGYADYFQYNRTLSIVDDHLYINEIAKIPCINIIQHDSKTESNFGAYWHTHSDNLDIIDRKTLKAVGQTVVQIVYNE